MDKTTTASHPPPPTATALAPHARRPRNLLIDIPPLPRHLPATMFDRTTSPAGLGDMVINRTATDEEESAPRTGSTGLSSDGWEDAEGSPLPREEDEEDAGRSSERRGLLGRISSGRRYDVVEEEVDDSDQDSDGPRVPPSSLALGPVQVHPSPTSTIQTYTLLQDDPAESSAASPTLQPVREEMESGRGARVARWTNDGAPEQLSSSPISTRQSMCSPPLPTLVRTRESSSVDEHSATSPTTTSPRPDTPASLSAVRSSTSSLSLPTNSSTLSLPNVEPVDLALPNRPPTPFLSVADSRFAELAAGSSSRVNTSRRPRAFITNLLTRAGIPRSPSSPSSPERSQSLRIPSPSSRSSSRPNSPLPPPRSSHNRTSSLPSPDPRIASFAEARADWPYRHASSPARPFDSTEPAYPPRSPLRNSFPSNSRSPPPPLPAPLQSAPELTLPSAPKPTTNPPPPSLGSVGLVLATLTPVLSHLLPLCGALLDNKFILIGSASGLDFLPVPSPGYHFMPSTGKKRKDTRKPISLIKRTRFRELAILSERSNVLLAIAGKNDHIRVYGLEGIRTMIEKKMSELNSHDGYPVPGEESSRTDPKGKGKATERPSTPNLLAPPSQRAPQPPSPLSSRAPASFSSFSFPRSPPPSYPDETPLARLASLPPLPPPPAVPPVPPIPSSFGRSASGSSSQSVTPSRRGSRGAPSIVSTKLKHEKSKELGTRRRSSVSTTSARRVSSADPPRRRESGLRSRGSVIFRTGENLVDASREGDRGEEGELTTDTASDASSIAPLPSVSTARLEPRLATSRRASSLELAQFLRETGPSGPEQAVLRQTRSASSTEFDRRIKGRGNEASTSTASNSWKSRPMPRSATASLRNEDGTSSLLQLAEFFKSEPPPSATRELPQPAPSPQPPPTPSLRPPPRPIPREPSQPRLRPSEISPALELADFLRQTAPPESSLRSTSFSGGSSAPASNRRTVRPTTLVPNSGSDFGALLREIGTTSSLNGQAPSIPATRNESIQAALDKLSGQSTAPTSDSRANSRLEPRGAAVRTPLTTEVSCEDEISLAQMILEGGRHGSSVGEVNNDGQISPNPSTSAAPTSPSRRHSKRWTMSGVGSLFQPRPSLQTDEFRSSPSPSALPPARRSSSDLPLHSSPRQARDDPFAGGSSLPSPPVTAPLLASTPLQPHDFKHRQVNEVNALEAREHQCSPTPTSHIASSSVGFPPGTNPLEYIKLSRTKGARLLRAVETKKRTYLAVLCGDEGERIELFTGSKGVSLSLNRTFVLPENPTTIEFQLQGDDLIDIYLVYPESIFALEPATVRVREVGVGRNERRARSESQQRLGGIESTPVDARASNSDLAATPAQHPADTASAAEAADGDPTVQISDYNLVPPVRPATPSMLNSRPPSVPEDEPPPPPVRSPSILPSTSVLPAPPAPSTTLPQSTSPMPPAPVPPRAQEPVAPKPSGLRSNKNVLAYSTFSQLPFVPPVPSSILASAWTIPPLYTDVVAIDKSPGRPSSPHPSPSVTISPAGPENGDTPLLSPISLLSGVAQRGTGSPPGLFFVTKGRHLSGIVTADGRSVIKKPLTWLDKKTVLADADPNLHAFSRVELLVVKGNRTVIVGIGEADVRVIAVGGEAPSEPIFSASIPVNSVVPTGDENGRQIQHLATHHAANQLFYAESLAPGSFVVRGLATRG